MWVISHTSKIVTDVKRSGVFVPAPLSKRARDEDTFRSSEILGLLLNPRIANGSIQSIGWKGFDHFGFDVDALIWLKPQLIKAIAAHVRSYQFP